MKFGQLIEYNTRNNFLEKSDIKCGREAIFKIVDISRSIVQRFLQLVFIACYVEGSQNTLKLS